MTDTPELIVIGPTLRPFFDVDSVGGFTQALADGNILGAVQIAGTSYNTFKNANLKQVARSDINGILTQATQQALPGSVRGNTFYPGYGVTPAGSVSAGAPTAGVLSQAPRINGVNTTPAGTQG